MILPTQWRIEDLSVGMVIYNPPMKEVDPVTMKCTDVSARLIVDAIENGTPVLRPYHGDREGVYPPER